MTGLPASRTGRELVSAVSSRQAQGNCLHRSEDTHTGSKCRPGGSCVAPLRNGDSDRCRGIEGGSQEEETGWTAGLNGQPWGELPAKGNRFPFPLSQTCQALNERFLAIPENIQTWTEIITFSMSWRLRLLFQMINQTLFASQSWSVCSFGSGFIFYVPSAAFLIVDRSSWQLQWGGQGPRRGTRAL